VKRRAFLRSAATGGTALIIGLRFGGERFAEAATGKAVPSPFDAWVRIDPSGDITLICGKSEMGQGVHTSLTQILADELDADWSRVRVEQAPTQPQIYDHGTGGSSSVRTSYLPLRQAAAAARAMLVDAAAERWKVKAAVCRTEAGFVVHGDERLGYGELVAAAARRPIPDLKKVALKDPAAFRLIGKSIPRSDIPAKVDGSARFGIDVRVPGMLFAVIARCPTFGGKPKAFDPTPAKAVPGVRHVVEVAAVPSAFSAGGVAVVADTSFAAMRGRNALAIEWDHGPHAAESNQTLRQSFEELTGKPAPAFRNDGDAAAALAKSAKRIDADYELPFQAHAQMEPLNATAHVRGDVVEAWLPAQDPTWGQDAIAKALGVKPAQVTVHTTLMGGGFGRRAQVDFIVEAAQVSKAVGAPVQVLWTREDDMQHGFYRPAALQRLTAGLDARGQPIAWHARMSSVSIARMWEPEKHKPESSEIDGAANLPYAIPNIRVEYADAASGVPRAWWRSVEHSINGFVVESFVDELATAAGADPLAFRLQLLAEPRSIKSVGDDAPLATQRLRACLELAAQKAGWGQPLPAGRARGIACHYSFMSYAAQVAEVSVESGRPRVWRVVAAIDCGRVVNPDGVAAQVESAIVYGLSAALKGAITIAEGRCEQSNFHDFEVLRIDEMPAVEVHLVPSSEPPTGIGEPGLPPLAAAVANAIFAATGKRLRRLPIRATDLA